MYHPRLKGSHYEMGLHYGEILSTSGVDINSAITLTEEQIRFGKESLPIYENYVPELLQEITGLAEGAKVPFEDMFAWLASMYGFGDIHGCTCFAFHDGDQIVLCRNSDMYPELKKTSESVLYRADGKNILLGNSTSFIQLEDGMNEHGLAVGMNFLLTRNYKPGLNTGFVIRAILENCKTTQDAILFIKSVPLCSTQNILLADKSGDLAVVEASPNKVSVRRVDNYIVSANHFVCEDMQREHANPAPNWYRSNERYETACKALTIPNKDINFAMRLAGGEYGFICQYEKKLHFDTLWSSIYDIGALGVFRAEGNPSKTSFQEDTRLAWGIKKERQF